ncbi:MAG: M20/M25/M40 family metallo-hydrolase, partial [Lachnospiraceae bacterium]|nr:M20/M25/M40 family metallo-hydrolase [Lachnospiraceae bacterium]
MDTKQNNTLADLEPKEVFRFFDEICKIPHGSGNTKAISDHLAAFARERNLPYRQDDHDNTIIWKDASAGFENAPTVIIQGHMDMVCVAEDGYEIDFAKDGLIPEIKDGSVTARGTSLGGDDGIAVAMALAILDSDTIKHPPLEVVITSDEEIGMLGAQALDCSDLKGTLLLNIDSEDEGRLTLGCAGGATV